MFIAPIIEPMFQLVQVGVQVLHADLVIRPDDRTFEQAPYALNAVRVNIPTNPLIRTVIDRLVRRIFISNANVGGKFVRVDGFRVGRGVLLNESVKRALVGVGQHLKANLAATCAAAVVAKLERMRTALEEIAAMPVCAQWAANSVARKALEDQ